MQILLVRHGETALNNERRIRGWLPVPLDAAGKREAVRLGYIVSSLEFHRINCSDLERTRETADIMANICFAPVYATEFLRPWNVGDWAGQKFNDALVTEMTEHVNRPDLPVPNGESFNAFVARWRIGFKNLVLEGMRNPDDYVIAVTHSRNIESTPYLLRGDKSWLINPKDLTPPGGILLVELKDGKLVEKPFIKEKDEHIDSERQETNPRTNREAS